MPYCYRPKKDVTGMKQFLVKLQSGKEAKATISYKEKLETVKELDALIAACDDRLELNESLLAEKKITAIRYENTRSVEMRERDRLNERRDVIKDLVYVGQSIEFIRYLPAMT